MKLTGWWNYKHLHDASELNGSSKSNYFVHLGIGLKEAGYQFLLCIASVVHAFIPPLFNFKLLELVVNQTIGLHKFLPQHPIWDKLRKELDDARSK